MARKILIPLFAFTYSITASTAQEYFTLADQELNNSYNQLMATLPTTQQKSLRDAQRLWISYTDADCKLKADILHTEFTQCKAKATKERTQEFINDFQAKIAPQVAPAFTQELKALLTNLETTFAEETHAGPSTITTNLLHKMSFYSVAKAYGKPIFHAGPHNSRLDFSSITEFGHYDPEFLTWFDEHLTSILSDSQFVAQTKPAVSQYLLNSAELFLTTHYYLKNNPLIAEQLLAQYKTQYQQKNLQESHHYAFYIAKDRKINPNWDGKINHQQYIWEYPLAKTQFEQLLIELDSQWYYAQNGTAIFFWVRRAIDGTDEQFINLLIKFYQAYNPEKLLDIQSKNHQLPSNLPLGDIKF